MIKNPFNYTGAKFKLLPQILPLFPKNIDTFIDLFGGGGDVIINTPANNYIYNDINLATACILKAINYDYPNFITTVDKLIKEWKLSKESKEEYYAFRTYFNENKDSFESFDYAAYLYALITHSFNYQVNFNSSSEFNSPSGAGRSYLSPPMRKRLAEFADKLATMNILFYQNDFRDIHPFNFEKDPSKIFVYADPPYLISTGAYQRDYFSKWDKEKDLALMEYLDNLNSLGIKFAMSNVTHHHGKKNDDLIKWAEKYNVHYIDSEYKNCNYQLKDIPFEKTVEVLITNY